MSLSKSILDYDKLQKKARQLASSTEGILDLDSIMNFSQHFNDKDKTSVDSLKEIHEFYRTFLQTDLQKEEPDFLKLCYSSVCISEDLITLSIENKGKEIPISSYIQNNLYKNLGVSIVLPISAAKDYNTASWIREKMKMQEKYEITPDFISLKYTHILSSDPTRKESIIADTLNIAVLSREVQSIGIVPLISMTFQYGGISDIKEATELLRQFLAELVYSLQRTDAILEALVLSLSCVGVSLELKNDEWKSYDSLERIIFLNQLMWLKTIPVAVPIIIVNQEESSGRRGDFIRHCQILDETHKLDIDCPWTISFSAGKALYNVFLEEQREWKDKKNALWGIFNRRLKIIHESHLGSFSLAKTKAAS